MIAGIPVTVDLPGAGDRDRPAGRLAALPDGLRRAHRGRQHPPQPGAGLHPAAGGGDHHGGARGRLDGQGLRPALPRLHHRARPTVARSPPACRTPAARWPTTCWSSPTPMPVCCNRFRARRFGQYGPLGGENPVGFTPNGVSDTLEPAEPVIANPGTVNSDGSPNKPNVGIGYAAGTGGGYGPVGRQRVAGVPAVRARPEAHPGDGQLRREHRRGQGHLGLVPAAAPHAGPAAGDRRRRGSDLVLRRRRRVQLRAVAEAAVGRAPAGRQSTRRSSEVQPIDVFAAKGVAQPAFPAGVGAAGGQRRAHRRRRPQPVHRPVVRRSPRRGCRCCRPHSSSWVRRPRC